MLPERLKHWSNDVLLDPEHHPVGTRILLTDVPSHAVGAKLVYEATVMEWSPSGKIIRIKKPHQVSIWCRCRDYVPIVVEVLGKLSEEALAKLIEQDRP